MQKNVQNMKKNDNKKKPKLKNSAKQCNKMQICQD